MYIYIYIYSTVILECRIKISDDHGIILACNQKGILTAIWFRDFRCALTASKNSPLV